MNFGLSSLELENHDHLDRILSPNDKTEIAISTALKISVFKINVSPKLAIRKSSLTPPSLFLTLVYERNPHSHLVDPSAEAVCVAWKPDRKYRYIFAVGFNNGKVILLNLSPNQRDNPHYINNVYGGGGNRACSSIVWNPIEPQLLAIGFHKVPRPDQSLRIWDVNCSSEQMSGGLGSLFPAITTGHINSLCWIPNSDQSLLYSNKSGVGVYDYNNRKLRGRPNRSKAIHGVCGDPLSQLYVASFYDVRVRVWCIADISQPLLHLDTAHPIVSIAWSPLRARTLLVLTSYPYIYMLPLPFVPRNVTDKEPENTDWLCNLVCEPLHRIHDTYPTSCFSFLPHPTSRDDFLLLQSPAPSPHSPHLKASIEELPLPAFISISISSRGALVSASDLKLGVVSPRNEISLGGAMRRYAEAGYCFNSKRNLEVCREELDERGQGLARLWQWVMSVESGLEEGGDRSKLCDVMLNGLAKSVLREVRIDRSQSEYCVVSPDSVGSMRVVPLWQQSPSRELCLRLLGWLPPPEKGGDGRTALCTLLSSPQDGVRKAINALQPIGTGAVSGETGAVVMALAGYPSALQNKFWVDTCISQTTTLTDPYLRLCVLIPYSDYSAIARTIRQERISHNDKFALACGYLRARDLDKFGTDLLKEIQDQSLLEGLFLTGLGYQGISIMKNYLSQGGDLLTVAILSSLTLKYSLEIGTSLSWEASELIQAWWDSLCAFLNQCCLWKERCRLEMERGRMLEQKTCGSLYKWNILCGFCGKQIAGGDRKELRGRRHGSAHPTPEKVSSTASCCPSCLKPLPRCVVCHRHMGSSADLVPNGSNDASMPIDDWMTWCQTCCHWGHNKHISDWFRENSSCPAPGCSCLCLISNNQLLT